MLVCLSFFLPVFFSTVSGSIPRCSSSLVNRRLMSREDCPQSVTTVFIFGFSSIVTAISLLSGTAFTSIDTSPPVENRENPVAAVIFPAFSSLSIIRTLRSSKALLTAEKTSDEPFSHNFSSLWHLSLPFSSPPNYLLCSLAACTQFFRSIAVVTAPTPPGTGVM